MIFAENLLSKDQKESEPTLIPIQTFANSQFRWRASGMTRKQSVKLQNDSFSWDERKRKKWGTKLWNTI